MGTSLWPPDRARRPPGSEARRPPLGSGASRPRHGQPGRLDRVDRDPGDRRRRGRPRPLPVVAIGAPVGRPARRPGPPPAPRGRRHRRRPSAAELAEHLPPGTEVVAGPEALAAIAAVADVVLNAVVGFAGLPVTLAALEAGRRLALANKESLIAGGPGGPARPAPRPAPRSSRSTPSTARSTSACGPAAPLATWPGLLLTASRRAVPRPQPRRAGDGDVDDALAHPTWRWARRSRSTPRRS